MIRFRIHLLLLLFSATFLPATNAQDKKVKISKSQFRTAQEKGLDEAWGHIREGDRFFKEGVGTYPDAREHYLAAYEYNNADAALNYKIGVCYLFADQKYKAIDSGRASCQRNRDADPSRSA